MKPVTSQTVIFKLKSMKNLFLFLVFVSFAYTLNAQIQKGSVLLGGTVGINNFSDEGESITTFHLSPRAIFMVSDRFGLGPGLNLAIATSDGDTEGSLGLSLASRVYFNKTGMSRFFAQLDIGAETPDLGADDIDILTTGGLGIGADFFLNEFVAIEGVLGYRRLQNFDAEAGVNVIGLNFGVIASIGGKKSN
jgi:hypothetical protein